MLYFKKIKSSFPQLALLIMMSLISIESAAQRFKGSAVLGLNFAQIDGDDLAGYNKMGLTGGFKLDYPASKKIDVSLEMLYSERGSTAGLGFGGKNTNYTTLKFLDLPLMVTIKDWYIEKGDYYKVSAHGGMSLGYLFDVASTNGQVGGDINNYNQVDVSYYFGVTYRFTKRFGLTLRHTRAFTSLLESNAISYFITVRSEYYF